MSLQGVKTPGTPLYLAAERERIKWSWELYGRGNLGECLSPLQKRQFTAWWSPRLVLLLSQSISYWGLGHGCYAGSLALSWREAHVSCKVFPCMHLKCIHRWGRARWRRESPSCPPVSTGSSLWWVRDPVTQSWPRQNFNFEYQKYRKTKTKSKLVFFTSKTCL